MFPAYSVGQVIAMTSHGSHHPHGSDFAGHIRITPALNKVESDYLCALVNSAGTLRGTPTGRGDRDVPFARLRWQVCGDGCCLTWDPDLEDSAMMLPTLRFLIDHLLGRGAKGEGRAQFEGFTFDHVLDGAVLGRTVVDPQARLVEVAANVVSERMLPRGCVHTQLQPLVRATGLTRRGRLPANVIELRPRRA